MMQTGYGGLANLGMWGSCYAYFKTLVAALDGKELVTAIVPVDQLLNMKQLAKAAGAKKAAMAAAADVERCAGWC